MTGRLLRKTAIVTGGGSGLGAASCIRFAEEGAAVIVTDLNAPAAEDVARAICHRDGSALAVQADVTSEADMQALVEKVVRSYGSVDVLYCNAGIPGVGTAKDVDKGTWDRVLSVMLTGVWLSIRAVLPRMIEQRSGSIITQASIAGLVGVKALAPYSAAKAGVIGLTRQVAVDFAPYQVRANAVCPGMVPTPLTDATHAAQIQLGLTSKRTIAEGHAKAESRYPLSRLGQLNDVANLALFLASDESAWITGQVFAVDGGYTAV